MGAIEQDPRQVAAAAALRQRAGEQAGAMAPTPLSAPPPEAVQQMLHELRVHQIELEMQNEELRRAYAEIEAAHARYFDLYDLAPVGYVTVSAKGLILEANLTAATLLGVTRGALVKQPLSAFVPTAEQELYFHRRRQLFETGEPQACELHLVRPDGIAFWARLDAVAATGPDGAPTGRVILSDINARKQREAVQTFLAQTSAGTAEEPFFQALARYLAQSLSMDFVCIDRLEGDGMNARTVAVWCDGHFEDNVTYALKDTPCGDVVGKAVCCFPASVCQFFPRDQVLRDLQAESYVGVTLFSHAGLPIGLIAVISRRPLAERRHAEAILQTVGLRAAAELERLDAEAERERLEAQVQQAQKMELVGRLAGGVAHDFNNLLMGIMNYVELCRDGLPPAHAVRHYLDEIASDAQRSAAITRQLLAFARKQIMAPIVLDLNDAVGGTLKMLRHLLGEDIHLAWQPGPAVWAVKIDPAQLDQILTNLTVNARDAIGGVGSLTISTHNVTLDRAACAAYVGAVPGEYAILSVCDSGCGMDSATLAHLFEPFFTTKGVGQGTGLGLATVHGIVMQNGGFIAVASTPEQGTTFRIHLPRAFPVAAPAVDLPSAAPLPRGTETILLVEDEKAVRVTVRLFLETLGYTVLAAADPLEARRLEAAHTGDIHLLLTDVVMPGQNGPDLAQHLVLRRPALKRLYMSGYTADVIVGRGVADQDDALLVKPFSREYLAHAVRRVLGS